MSIANLLKGFIKCNRAICDRIERLLPRNFNRSLLYAHELRAVAEIQSRRSATWVLDLGGGRTSPFVHHLPKERLRTLVALDISEPEIRVNKAVDLRIVGDVCGRLPLRDESIDVVVTRSVLEHLPDPRTAVSEIQRVLAPDGICIHVFPARFSPFSVLNRIVPAKVAHLLLFSFFPEWVDSCGFPAFYRHCDARAMPKVHTDAGLVIRSMEYRYYQSIYYKFFVPLYIVSVLYDAVTYLLGWPLLACQVLLVAEKRAAADHERHGDAQRTTA